MNHLALVGATKGHKFLYLIVSFSLLFSLSLRSLFASFLLFGLLFAFGFLAMFPMTCWHQSLVNQEHLRALAGRGLLDDGNWLALTPRKLRPLLLVTWFRSFIFTSET
jgi:hypothetical protein